MSKRNTDHVPPAPSGGSTTMKGILGGVLAHKLGYEFVDSGKYDRMVGHAQERVTHPLLKE